MRRVAIVGALVLSLSTVACASHEGPPAPKPEVEVAKPGTPEPEPEPEPTVRVAIASVQMIEDCPDDHDGWRPPPAIREQAAAPAQAPAPAAAEPIPADEGRPESAARMAPGAALGDSPDGWRQPCTQSTMQVVLTSQGDAASKVRVEAVRLVDPGSGKEVARLQAREPAAWRDGAYQSWDETVGPRQEVKASYELSVPEWSSVDAAIGSSSFGHMFLLELDVVVDGASQTVRSPQFPREEPHIVVT